jgi:hypothetical protein
MTAPFFGAGDTTAAALAVALGIGVAFGWSLERAGLGSARKLMGQFYLYDLTVFKVMFTAIITAMLGVFWLGRWGVVDVSRLSVPETFLVPQIAGGLIFGAGFAVAGLCPGTACVAAATGRGDGMTAAAGMFAGVLMTGLLFEPLERLYAATPRGTQTLQAALGVTQGYVVFGVVLMALGGFVLAERIERRG